jgi:hypothetical protein
MVVASRELHPGIQETARTRIHREDMTTRARVPVVRDGS